MFEYYQRLKLQKLGFVSSLEDLDCISADAFLLLDGEVDLWKLEIAEKAAKKGLKGRK